MPQTPCLFAPADDRNAPATPTAGWRRQLPAVQFNRSRMAQHVRMHLKADLGRDARALDQKLGQAGRRLSETKMKGRFGPMPRRSPPPVSPRGRVGMTAEACSVCGQQLNAPATPTAEGNVLAGQCQVQRYAPLGNENEGRLGLAL